MCLLYNSKKTMGISDIFYEALRKDTSFFVKANSLKWQQIITSMHLTIHGCRIIYYFFASSM